MAYYLATQQIRAPHTIKETNSSVYVQQRTLNGQVNRDYMGENKRVWELVYRNTKKNDYLAIKAIYNTYLDTEDAVEWEATEDNYSINETMVHVNLDERELGVQGSSYISDFTLILTEV